MLESWDVLLLNAEGESYFGKCERDEHGWCTTGQGTRRVARGSPEALEHAEAYMDRQMPHLDDLVEKAKDAGAKITIPAPDWDSLDDDVKNETESKWISSHEDDYQDSAIDLWREGLGDDVRENLRSDEDWHRDTWMSWATKQGFSEGSANEAADFSWQHGLNIDSSKLRWEDPDAHTADGAEEPDDPETTFDDELNSDWERHYDRAKDDEVQRRYDSESEDVPNSVYEEALENAQQAWDDLSDQEKLEYAGKDQDKEIPVEEPETYQPFTDHEGREQDDYDHTRAIALHLQQERTKEILKERGLMESAASATNHRNEDSVVEKIGNKVWDAWKESSTSKLGWMLQMATAEELHGEARVPAQVNATDRNAFLKEAREKLRSELGPQGFAVLKSYVRATWEASQYVLRKAGVDEFPCFRGWMLPGDQVDALDREAVTASGKVTHDPADVTAGTRLPTVAMRKNGCWSMTANADIANSWGGADNLPPDPRRVVQRVLLPRAGVLSLPCFGQNLYEEQEVVAAGTHYHGEDFWLHHAPSNTDKIPIPRKQRQAAMATTA